MLRRAAVLVVFGATSILTALLLAGHGPWAGHTVWALDSGHGLNSGDLLPLGLWATVSVACLVLWVKDD